MYHHTPVDSRKAMLFCDTDGIVYHVHLCDKTKEKVSSSLQNQSQMTPYTTRGGSRPQNRSIALQRLTDLIGKEETALADLVSDSRAQ
jgi:hypothetical protein